MKHIVSRAAATAVVAALAGGLMPTSAAAEGIVNAIYRVSLTDPGNGAIYYTDRRSLRSWPSEEACMREKGAFSGFHSSAVEGFDLVNAKGKRLTVKMDSSYCVVRK